MGEAGPAGGSRGRGVHGRGLLGDREHGRRRAGRGDDSARKRREHAKRR
jgi:hypothetical protein